MFPKARLDALHDGIFSVAMTLLVLDVRLPEEFHPRDGAELGAAIVNLWPKFLPYLLSFTVLGLRWIASIEIRSRAEYYNRAYVNSWLFYLLLITCVPFSTIVVGRYGSLAPAVWLYAGHLLLIALLSMRMMKLTPDLELGAHLRAKQMGAMLLVLSALLTIVVAFIDPRIAMWGLALNFVQPVIARWGRGRIIPD
jgi:TMEM175 potassium channel family protein